MLPTLPLPSALLAGVLRRMAGLTIARTPETLAAVQQALCENHGDLLEACRALNVSYREVSLWRDSDPQVRAELLTAQMIGWAALENAAYQRGVLGVDKVVWYQGEAVGIEKVYSDGLLSQMLKARVPGYGDSASPTGAGVTVNVAVMPRANSYEEWVVQRQAVLEPKVIELKSEPALNGMPDVL